MPRGIKNPNFDQFKYQNDYNRKNYDRINLSIPKGRKQAIQDAARAAGQSTNEFILNAINEQLKRQNKTG